MRGTVTNLIDPPTPYEEPRVLWEFLTRLRMFDQEDVAVRCVRADVIRYLCWKTPPYDPARASRRS